MTASVLAVALLAAPVDLQWHGTDGCPEVAQVRARLDELVPDGPTLAAAVTITGDANGYRARVTMTGAQGRIERAIAGRSCATVADAATMVIAVHADALAAAGAPAVRDVLRGAPPIPEPPPSIVAIRSAASRPVAETPVREPRGSRVRSGPGVGLRIGSGVSLRQVPSPSPLAILGAGVAWNRVRLDLELGWTFATYARLSGIATRKGADVGLVHGAARVSWVLRRGRFELPLGGGLAVGDMVAAGTGLARNRTRHDAWLAVLADAGLVFAPIPALALFVAPQLAVSAVRPRFVVDAPDGPRGLYRPPVIGVRVAAGVEIRLR